MSIAIGPEQWGPKMWDALHFIALGYPANPTIIDRDNYKTFFVMFGQVIPCIKCSVNYKMHLQELPIDPYLRDGSSLFEWTVKLHNIVNKENGKAEWTVEQAKAHYVQGKYKTPKSKNYDSSIPIILMLVLVPVIVLIWYKAKK